MYKHKMHQNGLQRTLWICTLNSKAINQQELEKVMNMHKSNVNARGMNELFLCKLEWLPFSEGWDGPVQGH